MHGTRPWWVRGGYCATENYRLVGNRGWRALPARGLVVEVDVRASGADSWTEAGRSSDSVVWESNQNGCV